MSSQHQDENPLESRYDQAMEDLVHGRYEPAYSTFADLLAHHKGEFEAGFLELRLGTCCHHMGKTDPGKSEEAITLLQEAYRVLNRKEHQFEYMRVLDLLGTTYWDVGEIDETIKYLEEGLDYLKEYSSRDAESLRMDEADYFMLLGDAYLYRNRYEESLSMYERARQSIHKFPGNSRYLAELDCRIGRTYHYKGDDASARKYLEHLTVHELRPSIRCTYHFTLLRLCTGTGDYEKAISHFDSLSDLDVPESRKAYAFHFAAIAHYVLGHSQEALELFEKAVRHPGPGWISERSRQYIDRIRGFKP